MYQPTIDALRRGAADEALSAARTAVAAQPQDPTAQRLLAAALRLSGDRAAAIATIDHAIALAPDDADLHLERAGLLVDERQLDEAEVALARSVGLDPNQFSAYVLQAQLALGRGDLDEAQRLTRTGARIAPLHPQIAALEGTLALRRGDPDRALAILVAASQRAPEDLQLRHVLGLAYLAKGHYAFAEQAFRSLVERNPTSLALRALVADLLRRQGRPADAANELAPLLEGDTATPALQRLVGELELEAGRTDRALPLLRSALGAAPQDQRTLLALVEAWHRLDAAEEARQTLDAALATHPQQVDLWRARLSFEPLAGAAARTVVERWQVAMPDAVPALEAQMAIHDQTGEFLHGEAIAQRIVELQPGNGRAQLRLLDSLRRRDPAAAVERVDTLLATAETEEARRRLRQLRGCMLDFAGRFADAAATWAELQHDVAPQRPALPAPSAARNDWPPLVPAPDSAPGVLLLWGAPGSQVELLATTLEQGGGPLRADRFGSTAPDDLFQRFATIGNLADGSADSAALIEQWRGRLPSRGCASGSVFDWLPWWDNALLLALRPHLPEATLLVALRDPRDMLLDWLGFGAPAPFALEAPTTAAAWLAAVLEQVAELSERDLFPHRLLKLDDVIDDAAGMARLVGDAMQWQIVRPPQHKFGPARLAPGHWRRYAEPLAEAFALLTPVAQRLGYPAD